jgi:chromosome segregation ATPase
MAIGEVIATLLAMKPKNWSDWLPLFKLAAASREEYFQEVNKLPKKNQLELIGQLKMGGALAQALLLQLSQSAEKLADDDIRWTAHNLASEVWKEYDEQQEIITLLGDDPFGTKSAAELEARWQELQRDKLEKAAEEIKNLDRKKDILLLEARKKRVDELLKGGSESLGKLTKEIENNESQLKQLTAELDKKMAELKEIEAKLAETQAKFNEADVKRLRLLEQIEVLDKKMAEASVEIKKLEEELKAKLKEFDINKDSNQRRREGLEKEIKENQTKINNMNEYLAKLEAEAKRLREEGAGVYQRWEEKSRELQELKKAAMVAGNVDIQNAINEILKKLPQDRPDLNFTGG